jgi:uncharacterized membrane protein YfhO
LLVEEAEAALVMVAEKRIDFNLEVVLEGEPEKEGGSVVAAGNDDNSKHCMEAVGKAVVELSENPNEVVIHSVGDQAGWVVLGDTWYPGWRAWVDGEQAPIQHANYVFRAVAVPAGTHEVRMNYRPMWFYGGLGVSMMSVAGWMVVKLRNRQKR